MPSFILRSVSVSERRMGLELERTYNGPGTEVERTYFLRVREPE